MESCADWTLALLQWDVQKVDGKYILTLEDSGRPLFLRDINGQLIGSDKALPPLLWSIRPIGESYTFVPACFSL